MSEKEIVYYENSIVKGFVIIERKEDGTLKFLFDLYLQKDESKNIVVGISAPDEETVYGIVNSLLVCNIN